MIYSIIISCRSRGIDLYAYINDFLIKLPMKTNRQIVEITHAARAHEKMTADVVKRRSA